MIPIRSWLAVCLVAPVGACAAASWRSPSPDVDSAIAPAAPTPAADLGWHSITARLPVPVANNAVAAVLAEGRPTIVSLMGLGAGKTHDDIVVSVFAGDPTSPTGLTGPTGLLPDVPGPRGRLASAAAVVDGSVWLFGGYTVDPDGHEVSTPRVDVLDPSNGAWSTGPAMPIPVDDAVVAKWRDRILLVSGWSNDDNVTAVQWLVPATGQWTTATPIPGPAVFGHAGGVSGDVIVFCDGVQRIATPPPKYRAVDACWRGQIDPAAPESIAWTPLESHPGRARYRIAAGTYRPPTRASQPWIVFAGGTDNPYNYDGVGYDGRPSEPVADTFMWSGDEWRPLPPLPEPSMDHRGLVQAGDSLYLIGGLDAARQPTDRIVRFGPPDSARK